MRPEERTFHETAPDKPTPLDYAPHREPRGLKYWVSRFLVRLSKPMPLGMLYVIMFALSLVATILAVIITVIVRAFR